MFFGCRSATEDFLYKEELVEMVRAKQLDRLSTAFSRAGPSKYYVQHRIAEAAADVAKAILEQGARVFLCGDGRHMAQDVHAALVACLAKHGPMSPEAAEEFLGRMKTTARYCIETWM